MKNAFYILLFVTLLGVTKVHSAQAQTAVANLQAFAWEKRILLVNSQNIKDLQALLADSEKAPLHERKLVWFYFNQQTVKTNYQGGLYPDFKQTLLQRYPLQAPSILLIGYDGRVKLRQRKLDLLEIYRTIDGMPMRQLEMQRNQSYSK